MRTTLLLLSLLLSPMLSDAQTLWRGHLTATTVALEFLKPNFSTWNSSYSGLLYTVSGSHPLGSTTTLIVEIPFAAGTHSSLFGAYEESGIGNPYLGVEFGPAESAFFGEIGFRIPLMQEEKRLASSVGVVADFDRFEAYVPNRFQVTAAANYDGMIGPSLRLLARVGPSVEFSVKQGSGNGDLYASYGATLQYRRSGATVGAGYNARALLTRSSIADRVVDQLLFGASYRFSRTEPCLQYRLPLDDYLSYSVDAVYLLGVRFFF